MSAAGHQTAALATGRAAEAESARRRRELAVNIDSTFCRAHQHAGRGLALSRPSCMCVINVFSSDSRKPTGGEDVRHFWEQCLGKCSGARD